VSAPTALPANDPAHSDGRAWRRFDIDLSRACHARCSDRRRRTGSRNSSRKFKPNTLSPQTQTSIGLINEFIINQKLLTLHSIASFDLQLSVAPRPHGEPPQSGFREAACEDGGCERRDHVGGVPPDPEPIFSAGRAAGLSCPSGAAPGNAAGADPARTEPGHALCPKGHWQIVAGPDDWAGCCKRRLRSSLGRTKTAGTLSAMRLTSSERPRHKRTSIMFSGMYVLLLHCHGDDLVAGSVIAAAFLAAWASDLLIPASASDAGLLGGS
jgi:hypothetical protein